LSRSRCRSVTERIVDGVEEQTTARATQVPFGNDKKKNRQKKQTKRTDKKEQLVLYINSYFALAVELEEESLSFCRKNVADGTLGRDFAVSQAKHFCLEEKDFADIVGDGQHGDSAEVEPVAELDGEGVAELEVETAEGLVK